MEEGIYVKVLDYDDLQTLARFCWGSEESTVRLPSDRTAPEKLDGPCKTYCLGKPMSLRELEQMPEDLQLAYLRRLRRRGGTPVQVGRMLGMPPSRLSDRWPVCFDMPNPTAWAEFLGQ